jgi:hypothetical protein
MSLLQKWGLIAITVLALMAGSAGAAWFAADAHYSKQYTALKASYEQASKDQAAEDAAVLKNYAQAALEVQGEAQSQIAGLSANIRDLGVRVQSAHSALRICTSGDPVSSGPVPATNGPGTGSGPTAPANAVGSTQPPVTAQTISIDPDILRDDLQIGIKATSAELLYRQLLRDGGQAKASP